MHRVIRKRLGPGGMGPGAAFGEGHGRAMAFAFGGPDSEHRMMAMGPGGMAFIGGDDDTFLFEPDFAFDDDFDIEVEVDGK